MGKRALFWAQPDAGEAREDDPAAAGPAPLGKHALYSGAGEVTREAGETAVGPLGDRGPVTVECSRCRVVSRIGYLDLLIYQLPIGYWLPRGKFDRRMTCPACRRRTWASVTLRRS